MMIRVNPLDMHFEMDEKFLQETCIGYNGGAFFKSAIICERPAAETNDGMDVEMKDEEETNNSKLEERRL